MKYCKRDKISAKDTDVVCPRCGGPLSTFGSGPVPPQGRPGPVPPQGRPAPQPAASPKDSPSAAMFTLQGEVSRLEVVQEANQRRRRTLSLVSLAAALAIAFVLWQVYASSVLSYAILEDVRIVQDPNIDHMIYVSYRVTTPGKVAFERRSGSRHTEKVDVIDRTGENRFGWSWPSDPKTGIDFKVVYRGGWLLAPAEQRHFDVITDTTDRD